MNCISIGKTLGRCIIFFSNPFKMKHSHYESDKSGFRCFSYESTCPVLRLIIHSWIFVMKFTLVEKVELTEITESTNR